MGAKPERHDPEQPSPVSKLRQKPEHVVLTVPRISALTPRTRPYYVYDAKQAGLSVRVMPSGVKTFVYYRNIRGKPTRITLGRVGGLTLADARKACAELDGQRAAGRDPAAERKAERQRGATVGELFRQWSDGAKARGLRSLPDETRLWRLHLEKPLARRTASAVTTDDIERLIHRIAKDHPRTANRAYALLRRVFKRAVTKGLVPENPVQNIERAADVVRDRVPSRDELRRLLEAFSAEPEPWRSYFRLLLFTGARKSAVAAMRWQDLELEQRTWTVPSWASKNKRPLTLALVPQAVEILTALPRISDWVFPSDSSPSGHITTPTKAWKRVTARAEVDDLRLHDLRRLLGTTLAAKGASAHVISRALGHLSLASARPYVHLDVEAARAAVEGVTSEWGVDHEQPES
jgi:integrase